MNGRPPADLPSDRKIKIFPRNLTARAAYVVRGNPVSTRPESGVNNCYPGLEFDQRNLDQRFLPGLVFYYHRLDGARLIGTDATGPARGLTEAEATGGQLYLWALLGRNRVEDPAPLLSGFPAKSGMEVWRRVNDLLPGDIAIFFGPKPGFDFSFDVDLPSLDTPDGKSSLDLDTLQALMQTAADSHGTTLVRDSDGKLIYGILGGRRAPYLTDEGVIDPVAYTPGELTKTMCAPWMYDFRDCYCFYWSSNKPDIVTSSDGKEDYLNFIRSVQIRQMVPQPPDVNFYYKTVDGELIQRRDYELNYENMVNGWWQKLPVVLDDREREGPPPVVPAPPVKTYLTHAEAIAELRYLATVEHALLVEYLYAYYSMSAPRREPAADGPERDRDVYASASMVFQIAVDEMRHFLWANLLLRGLGAPPSVGRARRIAEPPGTGSHATGRKLFPGKIYLNRPFLLTPLTTVKLQTFIDGEAPSRKANQGLDGMYVELLVSVEDQPEIFPDHARMAPLLKLIADEGEGHWHRFEAVQATLSGLQESEWLRPLAKEPPTPRQQNLLDLTDGYYHSVLDALAISFSMGEEAGGDLVRSAVRSMFDLHEVALTLAAEGYLPPFNLPPQHEVKKMSRDEALELLRHRADQIDRCIQQVGSSGASQRDLTLCGRLTQNHGEQAGRLRSIVARRFET